jgi:hypothetical protein
VPDPKGWERTPTGGVWTDQYNTLGYVDITAALTRDGGVSTTKSFAAIEFHAGRVFYAGLQTPEWADTVFFSQLTDEAGKYGKCYQEADPTDETFNELVSNDGGFFVIPGMGGVVNMVTTRDALIVLGKEGVWEVRGGRAGFAANDYFVRKLSEEGCTSATGITVVENTMLYTGAGGIYIIAPNQYTGQLEVQNIITQTIQTKWNSITTAEQKRCQVFYDDALKRVYFMVRNAAVSTVDANCFNEFLIYDSKAQGWFRYTFDANGLHTACTIPTADDPSTSKKCKFFYEATSTTVKVADFSQTSFDDWDAASSPLPYLVFGHTFPGQNRKQAPIITVYNKRTETGYVANGDDWDAVNPSSTLMSAYWDWTNDAVTNKIGAQQEVYRHTRNFVPASADDVDGYPVVVTRNKVRGRGRALQLRFDGATDKDSHILGLTANFKVSRKK